MYGRIQEIHERTGRLASWSLVGLGVLGCMALDEGRYQEGLTLAQREIEARVALADARRVVDSQHSLACAWLHLGYYERALALETLSANGAMLLGRGQSQCAALFGQAWAHRQLGQLPEALTRATEAVRLVQGQHASITKIYALLQLAEARLALAQNTGDWIQAEATFAEVIATAQPAVNRAAEYEAMIGMAETARRRGFMALAVERIASVLPHLPTQSAESWAAPIQGYVRCVHILQAAHNTNAQAILGQGARLLDHLAQQISDDDLRQNFLNAVPAHRELVALQAELLVLEKAL